MKQILNLLTLLAALQLVGLESHAQSITPSTINAAGNSATIAGNIFDYSIGEMTLVSTFTNSSVIITQGLLQPVDGAITGIASTQREQTISVFPNPAGAAINILYNTTAGGELSYTLFDMTGKTVNEHTVAVSQRSSIQQLNISNLPVAPYILMVSFKTDGIDAKKYSFKIDKTR